MEKSQALGMVVGAGILGSLATYLLMNSNNEDTTLMENEKIDSNNDVENNTLEEIKKETTSFLTNFWRDTYKQENEKINVSNKDETTRESSSEDFN